MAVLEAECGRFVLWLVIGLAVVFKVPTEDVIESDVTLLPPLDIAGVTPLTCCCC